MKSIHHKIFLFIMKSSILHRIEQLAEEGKMKRVPLMAAYERDAGGEALLKDLDITEEVEMLHSDWSFPFISPPLAKYCILIGPCDSLAGRERRYQQKPVCHHD